ncbi:hypothetical protein ACFLRB_03205 [Acidobacteriota bacterium]
MNIEKTGKSVSIFRIIVLFFLIYAAFFIFQTSFSAGGKWYFGLADDAMISMTYAKNLSEGNGLVWQAGEERVEGVTNLLWVLFMAIFHLFPISAAKMSLFIQLSCVFFLVVNLFVVRKLAGILSGNSYFVEITAVFFTAFYFPLNYWSIHGFETGILTLLINMSLLLYLQAGEKNRTPLLPFVILGVSTLIRLDMAMPYFMLFIFHLFTLKKNRFRESLVLFAPLLIVLVAQTVFRFLYYGELLPNTYYLKMTGYPVFLRIMRGLLVFIDFLWKPAFLLYLLPMALLFSKKSKILRLPALLVLGQVGYSIYVGGDSWEWYGICNRFIVVVMPLFFILFASAIHKMIGIYHWRFLSKSRRYLAKAFLIVFLILSQFAFNATNKRDDFAPWLLTNPPFEVKGIKANLDIGLLIEKITFPETKIALTWAGTVPYFINRKYIDLLGKNDRTIARTRMHRFEDTEPLFSNNFLKSPYTFFYPGHLKWDFDYSIRQLKPDVIMQTWGNQDELFRLLEKDYISLKAFKAKGFQIILKKNSPHINWEALGSSNNRRGSPR